MKICIQLLQFLRHRGIGGIGIVRLSGDKAFEVLDKIFVKINDTPIKGYTMKYGHIVDPITQEIVDEVLVSYFVEPKSYTTENMCEINSHGGNLIVKKILELCLKNGAELAEPGEFTKRAFLGGRIDLTQAESVIDIINAKTEKESKVSIKQLEGFLYREIQDIKKDIMDLMVNLEVSIDYPEYDDIPEVQNSDIKSMAEGVKSKLVKLIKSFENGKIIKDGITVAIVGRPNAGKSSLLNAILKEERAIVTEYEGTTRDTIEEFITIDGIPLKIIDTAGIRDAKDEVEKIGINKSREMAKNADLVIAIFDSTKDLNDEDIEILNIVKNKKSIIVLNKIDLQAKVDENTEIIKNSCSNIIKMSVLNKVGLENLYNKISEMFNLNEINVDSENIVTNVRHKNSIDKAISCIEKIEDVINQNIGTDIITMYIKEVLEFLGEITGESVTEDIINEIFAKFCLGK